jgi:hypothetical protein
LSKLSKNLPNSIPDSYLFFHWDQYKKAFYLVLIIVLSSWQPYGGKIVVIKIFVKITQLGVTVIVRANHEKRN